MLVGSHQVSEDQEGLDTLGAASGIRSTASWLLTGTLSLVLPVASSTVKLTLDDKAYKAIEEQLDFAKNVINATLGEGVKVSEFMGATDATALEHGEAIRAQGAILRELHVQLKRIDPGFGGLVRVMNKRQEFLWVHPRFEGEY